MSRQESDGTKTTQVPRQNIKQRPSLEPGLADDTSKGNTKLARALGSPDYHTREKGVRALTRFLLRKSSLSDQDMMKIWKGLFYAFWHSDKGPVQMELAERFAAILTDLPHETGFLFFTCFMKTMRREWFGIDRLRLDKYLMLIRKFMAHVLQHLAASQWNMQLVSRYMAFIKDGVLLPKDSHHAVGLTYHLADLIVPEIKALASSERTASSSAPVVPGPALKALLMPFCQYIEIVPDLPKLTRVREAVFDTLLTELLSKEPDNPLQHLDIQELASDLFDRGAKEATLFRNRTALYEISNALEGALKRRLKLAAKAAASSGMPLGDLKPVPTDHAALDEIPAGSGKKNSKKRSKPEGMAAVSGPPQTLTKRFGLQINEAPEEQPGNNSSSAAAAPTGSSKKLRLKGGDVASAPSVEDMANSANKKLPGNSSTAATPGSGPVPQPQSVQKPKSAMKKVQKTVTGPLNDAAVATSTVRSDVELVAPGPSQNKAKGTPRGFALSQNPTSVNALKWANSAAAGGSKLEKSGLKANGGTSTKKRVQINLKKNLYFAFGGPVPPPEVRTPSRAKGGILKTASLPMSAPPKLSHSKIASITAAHATDQVSMSTGKQVLQRPAAPKAAQRARAALFF
ncbi:hypothetical protein CEUSTIGMA_g1407.t1 [Chlamydomonas eustigma]|uniref:Uncharacterized protein n=1 Tax=Chlamydomonas eustigma TaxID=1157962 RepID=A0A250WSZ1_9CHLO|nr:hypothetical protein CEUSTIGMA_g1407.t1 [Chlamydomonas eustigma]|eukprot:GAX73957.1 hypothetical protein CEUSTIGMA_g1407.t1 [Chlamydomonas eustigma]